MGARYGIYFQEEVHTVVTLAPKKIAFDRILVPSDFSDLSMCALEYAKSIARCYGSQILLEHVSQLPSGYAPSEMPWVELDVTLEVMRQGERRLEEHDAQLRAEGFAVQTILSSGNLQDEVIATAHDQKPDLMVLGTHAVKGVVRLFCGSDAEALLRRVDCPVLVIGPKVRQVKQPVWSLRDVLCASDLNPGSARLALPPSPARSLKIIMPPSRFCISRILREKDTVNHSIRSRFKTHWPESCLRTSDSPDAIQ